MGSFIYHFCSVFLRTGVLQDDSRERVVTTPKVRLTPYIFLSNRFNTIKYLNERERIIKEILLSKRESIRLKH